MVQQDQANIFWHHHHTPTELKCFIIPRSLALTEVCFVLLKVVVGINGVKYVISTLIHGDYTWHYDRDTLALLVVVCVCVCVCVVGDDLVVLLVGLCVCVCVCVLLFVFVYVDGAHAVMHYGVL